MTSIDRAATVWGSARGRTYELEPLSDTFGARVHGLDLTRPLAPGTVSDLVADLHARRVLVFDRQKLEHHDQVRFSRHFGDLDPFPVEKYRVSGHPEVFRISNIFRDGQPIGLYDGDEQEEWHTDYSWKPTLCRTSLLYSVIAPKEGGDTLFADATRAYQDLDESTKRRIEGLLAVHSMNHLVEQERLRNPYKAPLSDAERRRMPDQPQRLVHVHPDTGNRSLLLGSMIISGIVGLAEEESAELLDRLHAHATSPRYVYRHRWEAGDLVVWDNQATMHTRTACDRHRNPRLLYRTTAM